jgi:hypothetical protein
MLSFTHTEADNRGANGCITLLHQHSKNSPESSQRLRALRETGPIHARALNRASDGFGGKRQARVLAQKSVTHDLSTRVSIVKRYQSLDGSRGPVPALKQGFEPSVIASGFVPFSNDDQAVR